MPLPDPDKRVNLQWSHGKSETVLQIPIFKIEKTRTTNLRTQTSADFYRLICRDWVNVLAFDEEKRLILVRQHRHGSDCLSIELPAGIIDEDETPLQAAARELAEETGYAPLSEGYLLETVHPNPAIQSNVCHFVVFERVKPTADPDPEPLESIEVIASPMEKVCEAIRNGEIIHALMAHTILLYLFKNR